jgi:hypothetical protein
LPRPQNRSATRSSFCDLEQAQRLAHQQAVDLVVHLREIGRLERHADAEFRQRVIQFLAQRVVRRGRLRSLGLQPPLDVPLVGEGLQQLFVGRLKGAMMRSTSTVTPSPTATSICGTCW